MGRAGAAAMMRSPASVWRRTKVHSSSVSGPGLPRISSGMAILPTSWSSAARRTVSRSSRAEAEAAGGGLGELGDGAHVAAQGRVAGGEHAQQDVLDLARGGHAAGVLLGVHALVGDAQGLGGVGGLAGSEIEP